MGINSFFASSQYIISRSIFLRIDVSTAENRECSLNLSIFTNTTVFVVRLLFSTILMLVKWFIAKLLISKVDAQIIKTNTINRGVVDETQRDSSGFWVFNNSFDDLIIESILTNTIYGDSVLRFYINDSTIAVGDSLYISVLYVFKFRFFGVF